MKKKTQNFDFGHSVGSLFLSDTVVVQLLEQKETGQRRFEQFSRRRKHHYNVFVRRIAYYGRMDYGKTYRNGVG